ncbi:MAG: hypothetical protein B7Y99_11110 [Caulobacterales bacterium 32-69-10]|nr:MAG: hypothetical protein B7Y99_11110 [Caulobacterales bacterium 32-69-10]
MRSFLAALPAFCLVLAGPAPPPAQAQVQANYGGCTLMGRPVPSIPDPSLNDIAMAGISPVYGPMILYNPAIVNRARAETRTFFYYHECAHHALGHTLGFAHPQASEQQADCWAVRELFGRRLFNPAQLRVVQDEVATSPGDRTHLPGPTRAMNLYACLEH